MATILYVITKGSEGGAQRYVYDLARSLPHDRFTPVVAIGGATGSWLQEACTKVGIRTVTLGSVGRDVAPGKDLASVGELIRLFREERPAVVHLNSSKIGVVGAIAARLTGVPRIIFTAHGWAYNEKRPRLTRTVFWLAHALTMLLVDRTIANSAATARQAPIKKGLVTIPLGLEAPAFLSREDARNALGLNQESFIYGTIAELNKNKGLDVLIDALQRAPNVHAAVIGGGDKKAALIARAKAKRITERLTLLGHRAGAAQYLKAFDAFVLPSRTESAGYVLLEAGLADLPVVATNVGGIPEIIEDGITGLLVPSEDPVGLASAMTKLMEDESLRTHIAGALKGKVERDFALQKMVTATLSIYLTPTTS